MANLKTGTIRQKVLIPHATPEEVYKAFLSSKEHSLFTGSRARCSDKVGASFSAWDGYITGKNVELIPGSKIVQDWMTTEFPDGYSFSRLEISLEKSDQRKGTVLTMVQSKVPISQVKKYSEGWHDSYWNPMKEYFAQQTQEKKQE